MRLFACLFLVAGSILGGQDNSFVVQTRKLEPYFPSCLGNGVFSLVTSRLGITPTCSYMASVYDHTRDDVARIAELPAWNGIDVYSGRRWLSGTAGERGRLHAWQQTLVTDDGYVRTRYDWDEDGRRTSIDVAASSYQHYLRSGLRIHPLQGIAKPPACGRAEECSQ